MKPTPLLGAFTLLLLAPSLYAAAPCVEAGPQAPRDLSSAAGAHPRTFSLAPASSRMNLCNIHFHESAEHRGPGFAALASDERPSGYRCTDQSPLTKAQSIPLAGNHCDDIVPGDTLEVHWVFTTCDVSPGPGLGSCLSESCLNPQLRVEAQVFLVANDESAADFRDFTVLPTRVGVHHQPKSLPGGSGAPITYLGSTTGTAYDDTTCSPLQVTWSVRPACQLLDVGGLSEWCRENPFDEHEAHGSRPLVTDPALLAPIEAPGH